MVSRDIHPCLIPGICECHLNGKSDFVDAVSIVTWGDYPGLPRCALSAITSVLIKRGSDRRTEQEKAM